MTVAPVERPKTNGIPDGTEGVESSESSSNGTVERGWFGEVVERLGSPAAALDHAHCLVNVNDRLCELCATKRALLIGQHVRDVGNGILYAPAIQEALADLQSGRPSEGVRQKRIDLPLGGRQTLTVTVWRLPVAVAPAEVLLLVDLPAGRTAVQRNLRAPAERAPTDPLGSLSAETLRHDIRQPLQTLSLLQGVLAAEKKDSSLRGYIVRLREAIEALGGMLDVLDDLQHPSAIPPAARLVDFSIKPVLNRLHSEFSYHAEVRGIKLRVVSSHAVVRSDSRSLEQLLRALLLAAMKMTGHGKVLLGCRRNRRKLRIEVWIGGEMIAPQKQQGILDEFHRGVPPSNGGGLVHAIVKPLSETLGLLIKTRSRPGAGLLFTIDVPMSPTSDSDHAREVTMPDAATGEVAARGVVAAVSDSPSDREALQLLLEGAGYRVLAVRHNGRVELEAGGGMQPEVIVADFTELADAAASRLVSELRKLFGPQVPVVVIADEAWRTAQSTPIGDPVTYLRKPATAEKITSRVSQSLAAARIRLASIRTKDRRSPPQTIFIVDDDRLLLDAISALLKARGEHVEVYSNAENFLENYAPPRRGCIVVDDILPGLRGVELLEKLKAQGATLPAIMITGHGDIATAVRTMRVGCIDYIEKPLHHDQLLAAIDRALEIDKEFADTSARRRDLTERYATLTQRERQVLDLIMKGASSKAMGRLLNISQRTVENHRASVMRRMSASSLSDLIHAVMELRLSQDG